MCSLSDDVGCVITTTDPALQSVSVSFISGNLSVLSGSREIL